MSYLYVNGQNQDVWCRSNQIMKDATFYDAGQVYDDVTQPSCLSLNLLKIWYFEATFELDICDTSSHLMHQFCLCSD